MADLDGQQQAQPPRARRWLWFVSLWIAGVAALSVVALLMRGFMTLLGLDTRA